MSNGIKCSVSDGVQSLTFDRPEKKNAITSAMYRALAEALGSADDDPEVCVNLFLGNEAGFTAGNDLGDFLATAQSGKFDENALAFLRALTATEKPMIAAVDGPAIGIGTTLLLHCDLVFATPQATFRTPFIDLGLVPEAASSLLVPARIGHQRAFELLCMGAPMDAEGALAAGIINAIVPSSELEASARQAAQALAQKPQAALLAARRLMRSDRAQLDARIDEEIDLFKTCLRSAEAREAFAAFAEKRPPDFARARKQADS
jgi:enoyl-CoA hydratase/carnithine racemase